MRDANKATLYDVERSNGELHVTFDTIEDEPLGTILNERGEAMPKSGWMVRIDHKAKEQVTLSKGTMWLFGLVPVVLMVLLSWGSAAIGIARDDQKKEIQIQQLENTLKNQGDDIKELKVMMQKDRDERAEERVQNAKALGYQLKAAEGPKHGAQR